MPRDERAGQEVLVDLASAAARATGAYANFVLTAVDDHVIRMSVMTEPYYWHRHPDSDETFLVIEGRVRLETAHDRVELGPGQLYTVPAGLAHVTSPVGARSVNITVESARMSTERLNHPPEETKPTERLNHPPEETKPPECLNHPPEETKPPE